MLRMPSSFPDHNIASLLERSARAWPRLPAVALGGGALCDYATLAARAARLAGAFTAAGLPRGARVALVSRNDPAYIETLFGCWWAGLVAVPVNSKLHPKELAYVLANCGARWAFVDAAWHSIAVPGNFCPTPTCDVAYFVGFQRVVTTADLRHPVYPKDPQAPLCACFGLTRDDIEQDLAEGGVARTRACVLRAQSAEARCVECSATGHSCVADVQRYYMQHRRQG